MNFHDFKKSIYSAFVFFGTLVILSAAYAVYQTINSSEYTSGQQLSSTLFGKVVENITDLNTRVGTIEAGGTGVPTGAIMAFNLATCPTGWSEYTAARGRFLRGLDNGSGNDPNCAVRTGGCTVGSIQGDEFKSHSHPGVFGPYGSDLGDYRQTNYSTMNGSTGNAGGSETRPKNVMVLFCSKN